MNEIEAREIVAAGSGFRLEKDKPYTVGEIIEEVVRRERVLSKAEGFLAALESSKEEMRKKDEEIEKWKLKAEEWFKVHHQYRLAHNLESYKRAQMTMGARSLDHALYDSKKDETIAQLKAEIATYALANQEHLLKLGEVKNALAAAKGCDHLDGPYRKLLEENRELRIHSCNQGVIDGLQKQLEEANKREEERTRIYLDRLDSYEILRKELDQTRAALAEKEEMCEAYKSIVHDVHYALQNIWALDVQKLYQMVKDRYAEVLNTPSPKESSGIGKVCLCGGIGQCPSCKESSAEKCFCLAASWPHNRKDHDGKESRQETLDWPAHPAIKESSGKCDHNPNAWYCGICTKADPYTLDICRHQKTHIGMSCVEAHEAAGQRIQELENGLKLAIAALSICKVLPLSDDQSEGRKEKCGCDPDTEHCRQCDPAEDAKKAQP